MPMVPTITGVIASQSTSAGAPFDPFVAGSVSDPNPAAIDTLTITATTTNGAIGTLADGTGFSGLINNGNGTWTLTGNAAAITAELDALVFTPGTPAVTAAASITTFRLSDVSAGFAGSAVILGSFPSAGSGAGGAGAYPLAGLVADAAGDLFGTTQFGGSYNDGTVYALFKTSTGYSAPTTLVSFSGSNGSNPYYAGLIVDAAGDLFGTTQSGGAYNVGTVFELIRTGNSYGSPVTLVSFGGTNGAAPLAGLIADAAGDLFGTTRVGGTAGGGTVFELAKTAGGYGAVTTLANFNVANGAFSQAGLVTDAVGDVFGTTSGGGSSSLGTVFELVRTASGYSAPVTLASFNDTNGSTPLSAVVVDAAGNLVGTTSQGGASGFGTIFEVPKTASGFGALTTLVNFDGNNGAYPQAGLIADAAGDLFGTTRSGTVTGGGSVFELVKGASGYSAPITLLTFDGSNGFHPTAQLLFDAAGDLFGTTNDNYFSGAGKVFEITRQQLHAATVSTSVTNVPPPPSSLAIATPSAPVFGAAGASTALTGIVVSGINLPAADYLSVVVSAGAGTLAATKGLGAATVTGSGTGQVGIGGSLADVNKALATLTESSTVAGYGTITLAVSDSAGSAAAAGTIVVGTAGVLAIAAPTSLATSAGTAKPVTGVVLSEPGSFAWETFAVTVSDWSATLAASAGTGSASVSMASAHQLTMQGTLADINAALATLTVAASTAGFGAISFSASDSFGGSATGSTAVQTAGALTVNAPAVLNGNINVATAVSGLALSEVGSASWENFSVTLADWSATLAATKGAGNASISVWSTHQLYLTGTLTDINAALATVTETAGTAGFSTLGITATDSFGGSAGGSITIRT